jgi:hypothetical protein
MQFEQAAMRRIGGEQVPRQERAGSTQNESYFFHR